MMGPKDHKARKVLPELTALKGFKELPEILAFLAMMESTALPVLKVLPEWMVRPGLTALLARWPYSPPNLILRY